MAAGRGCLGRRLRFAEDGLATARSCAGGRAVRDSKQQDGPLLVLSRESRQAFLQQIV
ncbi:DUF397 domain-containing protein [Streptomyces sp. NBC_00078]|uniref:DUF397 domain-containing protein n=1 Tax=unclassified Streptomyces TaxID=2593676 RepID=UPI0022542EFD|nr:DUF397 domain-containing protein [Streptomyces sp. NBC_00078]MCX5421651.1 DUF397 domain-containing protein [Streptomyces sp. NBC_00078]